MTGFGGAMKNIGMGCGSRAGKMAMHSAGQAHDVIPKLCRGCRTCAKNCAQQRHHPIDEDHKAVINHENCVGCGRCIGRLQLRRHLQRQRRAPATILNCKMAEYTKAVMQDRPCFHISIVNQVSPYCDCHGENDTAIIPDVACLPRLIRWPWTRPVRMP